ncbi:MAG: c-type cytochrome [Gammaproteobacteria bacterium]|nr:c-type cytochrome [Gammaproteobacteria bacterium]MBU1414683.1 c-type cytochrome [Gammaproteobacteria bacterium]
MGFFLVVASLLLPQISFAADKGLQFCDPHGLVRGAEIAMEKGCFGCHTLSFKRVGPPYREIAAKYQREPISARQLAAKIKNGGTGVLGSAVMPENPITEDEALTLARWIMSL